MRSKDKIALILAVVLIFTSMSTACSSSGVSSQASQAPASQAPASQVQADLYEKADTTNWPKALTLTAGPMGGPWYPFMVTYSELIMETYPEISVTAVEGGGLGNMRLVQKGVDAQIGLVHVPVYMKAVQGQLEGLQPGESFEHVKAGISINASYLTPVVKASGNITTFGGVANKRYSPGLVTSGQEPIIRDLLAEYGLSYEKIRQNGGVVDFVNYSEMSTLMQDNNLDIATLCGDLPHGSGMEMEANFPIRILPYDPVVLQALKDKYPYIVTEMIQPGQAYSGQTEEVEVIMLIAALVYSDHVLPDDMIYHLTRLLLENNEELRANNPNLFYLTWDKAMTGLTEEVMAAGAYRAFMEGP